MIDTLTLKNFRRHAHTVCALSPFTVLVGPNGSGKTSVLDALYYLGLLYRINYEGIFAGDCHPSVLLRHTKNLSQMSLSAAGHDGEIRRALELQILAPTEFDPTVGTDGSSERQWAPVLATTPPVVGVEMRPWGWTLEALAGSRWSSLSNGVLLRVEANKVSRSSKAVPHPRVAVDGRNVASVLGAMVLADHDRFLAVCEQLRRVVPQFRSLRIQQKTVSVPSGPDELHYELVFEMDSGTRIPASQMSEGTLITLALLTAINAPEKPRLILMDDIHEALHPRAQIELMSLLTELTKGPDPVQIIATTHSPYIVDCVPYESVLVFAHRPDGTSAVRPLSDHPEIEKFRNRMTAGQLWTLDDETHWVTDSGR